MNGIYASCGNGILEPLEGEECDDWNYDYEDGCSFDCTVEYGYVCTDVEGETSFCTFSCGDGILDSF